MKIKVKTVEKGTVKIFNQSDIPLPAKGRKRTMAEIKKESALNSIKTAIKTKGRSCWKPQNEFDPIEANEASVRVIAGNPINVPHVVVRNGIAIYKKPKKYLEDSERQLRDKVIAYTTEGKRIFGYNKEGRPVCFAKRTNSDGVRCMNVQTGINGRCKHHGGHAKRGIEHWKSQHLRSSDELPQSLQSDMFRAGLDPDLLSLDHEIKLLDLREAQLKRNLDTGLSQSAEKELLMLLGKLETLIDKRKDEDDPISADLPSKIIEVWKKGKSQEHTFNKIRSLAMDRAKLCDTAHRREKDLRQMMRAEQAMALVTGIGAACRSGIEKTANEISTRYELVDKTTGQPVTKIDTNIVSGFIAGIGIKLSKLISGKNSVAEGTGTIPDPGVKYDNVKVDEDSYVDIMTGIENEESET